MVADDRPPDCDHAIIRCDIEQGSEVEKLNLKISVSGTQELAKTRRNQTVFVSHW